MKISPSIEPNVTAYVKLCLQDMRGKDLIRDEDQSLLQTCSEPFKDLYLKNRGKMAACNKSILPSKRPLLQLIDVELYPHVEINAQMDEDANDDLFAVVYLSDKIHHIKAVFTQKALVQFHKELGKQTGWLRGSLLILKKFALIANGAESFYYLVDSFSQYGQVGLPKFGEPESINNFLFKLDDTNNGLVVLALTLLADKEKQAQEISALQESESEFPKILSPKDFFISPDQIDALKSIWKRPVDDSQNYIFLNLEALSSSFGDGKTGWEFLPSTSGDNGTSRVVGDYEMEPTSLAVGESRFIGDNVFGPSTHPTSTEPIFSTPLELITNSNSEKENLILYPKIQPSQTALSSAEMGGIISSLPSTGLYNNVDACSGKTMIGEGGGGLSGIPSAQKESISSLPLTQSTNIPKNMASSDEIMLHLNSSNDIPINCRKTVEICYDKNDNEIELEFEDETKQDIKEDEIKEDDFMEDEIKEEALKEEDFMEDFIKEDLKEDEIKEDFKKNLKEDFKEDIKEDDNESNIASSNLSIALTPGKEKNLEITSTFDEAQLSIVSYLTTKTTCAPKDRFKRLKESLSESQALFDTKDSLRNPIFHQNTGKLGRGIDLLPPRQNIVDENFIPNLQTFSPKNDAKFNDAKFNDANVNDNVNINVNDNLNVNAIPQVIKDFIQKKRKKIRSRTRRKAKEMQQLKLDQNTEIKANNIINVNGGLRTTKPIKMIAIPRFSYKKAIDYSTW